MPDQPTVQVLMAHLWDIRAQCERQLRLVSDAQRLLNELSREARPPLIVQQRVAADVQQLLLATRTVLSGVDDFATLVSAGIAPGDESGTT
jgi:phytoene/squalene synthetase